jgi:hypothetical protein
MKKASQLTPQRMASVKEFFCALDHKMPFFPDAMAIQALLQKLSPDRY